MIRWALKQYLIRVAQAVVASMHQPEQTQRATFARLRRLLRGTELADASGFSRCASLEDCRALPAADGDTLKARFQHVFERGERSGPVFGHSAVRGFGRTSGTVENKTIPLNDAYFASYDRSLIRLAATRFFATGEWQTILAGKEITLGSRPRIATSPTGLPVGDISGLLPTRIARPLRRFVIPRHADLWIPDWPAKVERIMEQANAQPVHTISGLPALALDFARRVRARYGVSYLTELWPGLQWFVYGGTTLSPEQKASLQLDWCGPAGRLHFAEAYFATEGALGFSFGAGGEGLVLNTLEHLYLFVPESVDRTPCFAHELEPGRVYALAITTPGGLINYQMGDRIGVISKHPLRIRLLGREREELSLTGEKITLEQLDRALLEVGFVASRPNEEWPVIWATGTEKPHLVWGLPATGNQPAAARLDAALVRLNTLYAEALVHEKVIGGSEVVALPPTAYERYRTSHLGIGQFKPKRLFPTAAEFATTYAWPAGGPTRS